jgi:hypothetical protein
MEKPGSLGVAVVRGELWCLHHIYRPTTQIPNESETVIEMTQRRNDILFSLKGFQHIPGVVIDMARGELLIGDQCL